MLRINRLFYKHFFLKWKLLRGNQIILLTRIRNESLILEDSLNHFSEIADGIIVYDDASTDNTVEIAKSHPKVVEVIQNKNWERNRSIEETRHRQELLNNAKKYNPKWIFYADCDERFLGNIRQFLKSEKSNSIDAIKIKLFDAYMTKEDSEPYNKGKLLNFRSKFGPERRDIIMIWKNSPTVEFIGNDRREPKVSGCIITKFKCQHYGKSLSVEHWEETCNYYSSHFPKYAEKWESRKGKAIHIKSDFGRSLQKWSKIDNYAVKIN